MLLQHTVYDWLCVCVGGGGGALMTTAPVDMET